MISHRMALLGLGLGFLAGASYAQLTYPNCAPTANSDFTVNTLISRTNDAEILEPLKMDFDRDDQGNVNVFFIERLGAVKYYDAKTKLVRTIGTIKVETGNEDGLVGFALDPQFKSKKRIFVYYSTKTTFRIARFNLDPATLDVQLATEKAILEWPSVRGRWHTSGAIRFDAYGDLWISAGDNEMLLQGPANASSLRGSILRIHPNEDGSYAIPAGNFWETSAAYFDSKNNAAVAAKYRDSTKAKREVFVKGIRNAYTLTLDPVRRWAVWGDCGPDQEPGGGSDTTVWTEEHNVAPVSGFYGWPFWTSINHVQKVIPYGSEQTEKDAWKDWSSINPAAPVNPGPGLAIPELPPAQTGTNSYGHSCAMTGPIYRYDGGLQSSVKMPPAFNRIWLTSDFNQGWVKAVTLSAAGKKVGKEVEIFKGLSENFVRPLDFQQGPDGALYYLNYSCGPWRAADKCTGIYRIEYKGTCQDPNLKPELPTALARNFTLDQGRNGPLVAIAAGSISVGVEKGYAFSLHDMNGRQVRSFSSEGPKEYSVAELLSGAHPGNYFVRVESAEGVFSGKVSYFP